jgi:Ice-binding-like
MVPPNARFSLLVPLAASLLACAPSSAASLTSQEDALMSGGARTSGVASSAPSVGAAGNFAVLAGTAVTCTNGTITGNVGVSPGTAITQTSCPVTGTINAGNAAAVQANSDFFIAYDKFKALACDRTLTTFDSQTLSPGVYCVDAAATFTDAVLTLAGPANGLWIFKIGNLGTGALTGTRFSVVTPSGAPPCNNVFWWVAQAATMTDSKFVGSILAGAAISLTRGTFNGDAFAKAAVTITGTAVTACAIGNVAARACRDRDRDKDRCKCECKDKDKKHGHDDCDDDDDDDDHDGDNHHRKHEEHGR